MNPEWSFLLVVGCDRSGTTLLQTMLDAHPDVAVTHESHILPDFASRRSSYETDRGFASDRFLDDLFAHDSVMKRLGFDRDGLAEALRNDPPADTTAAIHEVFRVNARRRGKHRFGDKTPGYVTRIPTLHQLLPDAVFVHIVRDGRDVALSLSEASFGPSTLVGAAAHWRRHVLAGRRAGTRLGAQRYVEVRYEDLVRDPEKTLRDLCGFLGLDYSERMVERSGSDALASVGDAQLHRHLTGPIRRDLRDWRTEMGRQDLARVEAVIGGALEHFGYECATPTSWATRGAVAPDVLRWQLDRIRARLRRASDARR